MAEENKKVEEKPKGWSTLDPQEEVNEVDEEAMKEMAEKMAENDVAWHLMWKSVASTLYLIYLEMKRQSDFFMEGTTPAVVLTESPPKNVVKESPPKPKTVPQNVSSEKEIDNTFRSQLSDLMTPEMLSKVEISVEQDKVILRLPWLETGWAAINERLVEGMSAERIVDGRKTRYEFPKPRS